MPVIVYIWRDLYDFRLLSQYWLWQWTALVRVASLEERFSDSLYKLIKWLRLPYTHNNAMH